MIAEILLLQQLLEKSNMVTPPNNTGSTTATSTIRGTAEAAAQAYKDYIRRGREGFGR